MLMGSQYPMRWETSARRWWFETPVDSAAANGYFEDVRELLSLDGNLLIKLTSLRRIRKLEAVWEDEATFIDAAKGRGLVARELMCEFETSEGNILIDAGYGGWLLYTAAAAGDVELVRYLLKKEPLLVFGEGEYGVSDMLYAAARSKNAEIFNEILGLAHDIKCLGCNQEEDAAMYDPSLSFEMMSRAVHAAARGGSVEILRELLKHCLNVASYRDSQGSTALHSAASKGQLEVVEELLLASPEIIESTDYQGNTALHVAAYSGHFVIVKKLLLSFPQLLLATNNDGNTLLHMTVAGFIASGSRRLDKQLDLVRHLVSDKTIYLPIIVNCQNKEGRTAMHMAVLGKVIHEKLLELLLSVPGLDINTRDKNEMSAVDVLELNLLSGITSEQLLKKLALAGGKEVQSWAASLRNANVSYRKIHCSDNSPGTSFRSVDTDINVCTHIEDVSDKAKVERLLEVSSRRLSTHALFDGNDSRKHYLGNQKKPSAANQARENLATLLGWSNGIKTTQKQEEHRIQKNKQNTGNKSKAITKEETSLQIMHTKEWLHEWRNSEMPLPLRQRFSKTSLCGNHSDSFRRKIPPSPSTNHGLSNLCGNDFDGAVSPVISSSCSPSRSFSQSPGASSPSLSARFKCFIKKNGSKPISCKTSVKDDSEDDDNVSVGSDRRSLQGAMNQYFCFGIGDLPVENDRSKQRAKSVNSDLGQVGQLPNWLDCPQMVYSMI
jgi:ankyrin repeat protein